MDTIIRCPRCGEQRAVLCVFITPFFAMDATRCTACDRVVCGGGLAHWLRLIRIRRRPQGSARPGA